MTNDVRDTRARQGVTPMELADKLTILLDLLESRGALTATVCQLKPMRHVNVTPYNHAMHHEIVNRPGVFGCDTQIRMGSLARDGYHVLRAFSPIIDKTYACAVLSLPVPSPTPFFDFVHPDQQARFDKEWPRLTQSFRPSMSLDNHGWRR